jgi:flagellar motor switch protein FliM
MSSNQVLSQEEIDSVFRKMRDPAKEDLFARAQVYDFRRPDRIAKDQLRNIHLLHENFTRNLGASLSAYLRSYVVVNLVSVEQLSFREFTQTLPTPTSLITLGTKPYDGNVLLELNPALVFPILEMLLGGSTGRAPTKIDREVTEIEQSILDGLLRVILLDLRNAWLAVTPIDFSIESHASQPQLLQTLAAGEAVVVVGIEVRIGDGAGMMNIAIPSILVKMLRLKFDQQQTVRRTPATNEEHVRVLHLIHPATLHLDARLQGPSLGVEALLDLKEGDVLDLDYPLDHPVDLTVNGKLKYHGEVVRKGLKRAFQIAELTPGMNSRIEP